MIKPLFQFIICLAVFQPCKGQTNSNIVHKSNFIDSIQNAEQISKLITRIDKDYENFKVSETLEFEKDYSAQDCKRIADSLKVRPWAKADFDNNGLTDILVIGYSYSHSMICIFDKGGIYEINHITRRSFQECTFPVVTGNKIKCFFESYYERGNETKPRKLEQVVLTYRFGDFIEENSTPSSHKIEKIEYSTSGCFGICPIFKLTIHADRSAKWFADMYNEINNRTVKGDFVSVITPDKYSEIINLLNYIGFSTLQDNYAVSWTDDQASTLTITYDGGKTKTIRDYGLIGTYGLDRLYQMLFDLRANQKWTK